MLHINLENYTLKFSALQSNLTISTQIITFGLLIFTQNTTLS